MMMLDFKNREEYTFYLHMYLKEQEREKFRDDFLALHPIDQVEIFSELNVQKRKRVYEWIGPKEFAPIFRGMERNQQKQIVTELKESYTIKMFEEMAPDDMTDFFEEIPNHLTGYFLDRMDEQEAHAIKRLMSYEKKTAGSLMTTEYLTIQQEKTVADVFETLRAEGKDAEMIYYLYVVNENNQLMGVLSLKDVLTSSLHETVRQLMKKHVISVFPHTDQREVVQLIRDYDIVAIPVTTETNQMIGIVTVDDVMDVVEDEVTGDFEELAGAKGSINLEVHPIKAAMKRLPWLLLLMVFGMATASVVQHFEDTLAQLALLAIFIPLITDMGGNTGTQSLAVVVRQLTLEKLKHPTCRRMIKRELLTGLIMGIVCGLFAALLAQFYGFGNMALGLIVGTALFGTVVISTMTGTIIPIIIHKLRIDPTVASGPFITTINDIVGLLLYFAIASSLAIYL